MLLLLLKSLHVVGFVAWFAGLFYLVRIFVYHTEAMTREEPARSILIKEFNLMQWRVYKIICNPAMMLTWICGLGMLWIHGGEWFGANSWMHIKLLLLVGLVAYHLYCKKIIVRLERGEQAFSSFQFRLLNEVPTLFLLSIALLAVFRNTLHFLSAFVGVMAFGLVLFLSARAYKKHREKRANQ